MKSGTVDQIARAVLYEGYLLYPYRPSALKNQQRWNFGVLYPSAWAASQTASDRSYFQMECLAQCSPQTRLNISVRFLQLVNHDAGEREWQNAVEQEVSVSALPITDFTGSTHAKDLLPFEGRVEISAKPVGVDVVRLTVRVMNTSSWQTGSRNDALLHSLASAHAVLHLEEGKFVSQIDPPDELRETAATCENIGVWPVLVGEDGACDTMLGSPIILYDYPQVAPESQGDLFDSTEIDEILTLRILTMTDAEKEEMRRSDERARRILERLETSSPEHLLQLHGTIRGMEHAFTLQKGDRVRLRPRKRADIFDTLLEGKIAVIEAVEEDFEHNIHFAVVLEDDPGRDLGEMRQAGHRFFFSREEVEPVGSGRD